MKLKNMLPLFALMLLASCGEKKEIHIPVQAEQEGRWGMVTTDGEVVLKENSRTSLVSRTMNGFWYRTRRNSMNSLQWKRSLGK